MLRFAIRAISVTNDVSRRSLPAKYFSELVCDTDGGLAIFTVLILTFPVPQLAGRRAG
jgi:hypothetical protein